MRLKYRCSWLRYTVIGASKAVEDGFDIDFENESATMTALVDDTELFAAFGLADCGLRSGEAVDIS